MAERDKSQGIGFVFAPVKDLVKMADAPGNQPPKNAVKVQAQFDQIESIRDHLTNMKRLHQELVELANKIIPKL